MPLTEEQISTLESLCARLCTDPLCEVRRREDPRLHRLAAGTTALIAELRASQAEARRLREVIDATWRETRATIAATDPKPTPDGTP